MMTSLDILYYACTQPFGSEELFRKLALTSSLGAIERFEFVRMWGNCINIVPIDPPSPPPSVLPIGHSPKLWLQYGMVNMEWAAVLVHTTAIATVDAWQQKRLAGVPFAVRLSRFLTSFGQHATLSSAGPTYLSSYARCIAPGHCTSLAGDMPFAEVAHAASDDINTMMHPVISTTVGEQVRAIKWTSHSLKDILLVCALLSESTTRVPLFVNSDILMAKPETPAIFVFHDFGRPDCYGVVHNEVLHVPDADSVSPTLDTIGYYISIAESEVSDTFVNETAPPLRLHKYFL